MISVTTCASHLKAQTPEAQRMARKSFRHPGGWVELPLHLRVGVSSRAGILVGQVSHSVGLGNMAEKTKQTNSNHRNIQDTSRPPPTYSDTATLERQQVAHISTRCCADSFLSISSSNASWSLCCRAIAGVVGRPQCTINDSLSFSRRPARPAHGRRRPATGHQRGSQCIAKYITSTTHRCRAGAPNVPRTSLGGAPLPLDALRAHPRSAHGSR